MLKTINIPSLINQTRLLADQRGGSYVTDDEMRDLFQTAYDNIYMEIVAEDENYFLKETSITSDGEGFIQLPDDYYKLKLLRTFISGDNYSYRVDRKKLNEITTIEESTYDYTSPYGYVGYFYYTHLQDRLQVFPKSESINKQFKMYYIPTPTDLLASPENVKLPQGFDHYIKYYAASDIGDSESIDIKNLERKAQFWEMKIKKWASDRSKDFPKRVTPEFRRRRSARFGGGYYG